MACSALHTTYITLDQSQKWCLAYVMDFLVGRVRGAWSMSRALHIIFPINLTRGFTTGYLYALANYFVLDEQVTCGTDRAINFMVRKDGWMHENLSKESLISQSFFH